MKKTMILAACLMIWPTIRAQQAQNGEQLPVARLEQQVLMLENDMALLKQLKVSGYIQTQFQYGEKDASLKVGAPKAGGDEDYNRFGIRRGRLKFEYEKKLISGVFQIDLTEKGIGLKDAYLAVKAPQLGSSSFKAGVFNRPFGYEVSYSSSKRESPERATVITTLFPEERDLGAMISLQASKDSPWNIMKLEAAVIGGNGVKMDMDNRKDFIGRLSAGKVFGDRFAVGAGTSYYWGGVYQGTENVYRMKGKTFEAEIIDSNKGAFAKREYFGFDGQFSAITPFGISQLSAEFITGTQPGDKNSSKSPNYAALPTSDTYVRSFSGGYVAYVQDLGALPLSLVVKYDYYDPNTKVSRDEIGSNGTGKADIANSAFGAGLLWRMNGNMRLTAYYDWVWNEQTANLTTYGGDLKDDVFTLRLQYKF